MHIVGGSYVSLCIYEEEIGPRERDYLTVDQCLTRGRSLLLLFSSMSARCFSLTFSFTQIWGQRPRTSLTAGNLSFFHLSSPLLVCYGSGCVESIGISVSEWIE